MTIPELTDNTFAAGIDTDLPVVVDFWAPWCAPCKGLRPQLQKVADEYEGRVKFIALNTDENIIVASAHNVTALPTVLIFKDKHAVAELRGRVTRSGIKKVLEDLI